MFGLLGGVIVYFVLRKSDSSKAKICLGLGFGVTVAYFAYLGAIGSESNDNPSKITTGMQDIDVTKTRELEEAKYQVELEKQRQLEEVKYQEELERQRELEASKWDPVLVQSSKENIPKFQNLFRTILTECRNVDSYSEYQTFIIAIGMTGGGLTEQANNINLILTTLELQGYDEHPEVGQLIEETRQLAKNAGNCLDDILYIYGD